MLKSIGGRGFLVLPVALAALRLWRYPKCRSRLRVFPLFVYAAVMTALIASAIACAARGPRGIWFGPGPHSNVITTAPDEYAKRLLALPEKTFGPPRESHVRPRGPNG